MELLFGGELTYIVPKYQRDYCWDIDQLEDFWTDLYVSWQKGELHFMGNMLMEEINVNKRIVVDGQQRLTTFVLFIIAAERRVREIRGQNSDRDFLHDEFRHFIFLPNRDMKAESDARLKLNRHNQVVLDELLRTLAVPTARLRTPFNANIIDAVKYFNKKFQTFNELDAVIKFVLKSLESVFVTIIVTDHDSSSYKIYECLNNRGKGMTDSDLIKNHMFSISEGGNSQVTDAVSSCWNQLTTLGSARVDEYIRTVMMLEEGYITSETLLTKIKKIAISPDTALTLAEELQDNIELYSAVCDADINTWNKYYQKHRAIKQELRDLHFLGDGCQRSVLMAALRRFKLDDITTFVNMVERYIFRNDIICNNEFGKQEEVLCELGKRIWKGELTVTQACLVLKKQMPTNREFIRSFTKARIDYDKKKRTMQYILINLEGGIGEARDYRNATIEHVLPVNYTAEWARKFNKDHVASSVNRIGNVTFLNSKTNSKIGNSLFSDKKPILARSEYSITRMIAGYEKWNYQTLERHQRRLAEFAVNIW